MEDYVKQYQRLKSEAATSADEAIDYLDGLQLAPLETALNDDKIGISEWAERGVIPATENITAKIIERSALTYNEQPERTVQSAGQDLDTDTDTYRALLRESNWADISQVADQMTRLLKAAIIVPFWNETQRAFFFTVLGRHNCDIDFDPRAGAISSIIYTSGLPGPNGGRQFHHITPQRFTDLELRGGRLLVTGGEDNPYGIVPAAHMYDTTAPRAGFWPPKAWEELIRFNLIHNLWLTSVNFNARWEAFSTPVTNADIKNGTRVGPDIPLKLKGTPGQEVYFKFESPTINLEPYAEFFKDYERRIGDNWGVNIKHGEGAADSGFKLVVDEIWNLHTRHRRIGAAENFERRLYRVVSTMAETHRLGLRAGTSLGVKFPKPALPVNTTEEWQVAQGKLAAKVMSRREYIRSTNPGISEDDVEAKIAEIDNENSTGLTLPDFGTSDE